MVNYFGKPEEVLLREKLRIYDSNVFITSWVTVLQLEAALFPGGPAMGEKQLLSALDALQPYHDCNKQEGSSILVFWTQIFNETTGVWLSAPNNFGNIIADEKVFSDVLLWLFGQDFKNQSELLRELTATL